MCTLKTKCILNTKCVFKRQPASALYKDSCAWPSSTVQCHSTTSTVQCHSTTELSQTDNWPENIPVLNHHSYLGYSYLGYFVKHYLENVS